MPDVIAFLWLIQLGICLPKDDMRKLLAEQYFEVPVIELHSDNFDELYLSPNRTSWTIVRNYPSGSSCIVKVGLNWEFTGPRDTPEEIENYDGIGN